MIKDIGTITIDCNGKIIATGFSFVDEPGKNFATSAMNEALVWALKNIEKAIHEGKVSGIDYGTYK
jgi:phosphoribosylformylglycinamidine (FGAM) synthase-like amidotransferase family enzyme